MTPTVQWTLLLILSFIGMVSSLYFLIKEIREDRTKKEKLKG